MELFDTHCHVHELLGRVTPLYEKWRSDGVERTTESVLAAAREVGVTRAVCIGTTLADSKLTIRCAAEYECVWASIGIHPHEAALHRSPDLQAEFAALATAPKVVAVGECGLDYYYNHSPRKDQIALLQFQIELALQHDLALSFHVREAFDDFWPLLDTYRGAGLRGVLHSFTDSVQNMERALTAGLYIGVNGIATFAKQPDQVAMYRAIPNEALLFETDAPFLTPVPYRGKVCELKHVRVTAEYLAQLRNVDLDSLARVTTENARALFKV